jgi:hypothetical protein
MLSLLAKPIAWLLVKTGAIKISDEEDDDIYMPRQFESDGQIADEIFATARESFLEDGRLDPYSFLIKDRRFGGPADFRLETPEAAGPKMMEIVRDLVSYKADAVIILTEAWTLTKDFYRGGSIANLPDRGEAITLNFCSASGEAFIYMALIQRDGDKVSLGETMKSDSCNPLFEPIKEAWSLMAEKGLIQLKS